jgi:DNA-3-methyladenine glycosylase I
LHIDSQAKTEVAAAGHPARCAWCDSSDLYRNYHDCEWGFPVQNDTRLFEKICLEGFQSGLSWLTILRKRENFRAAFADFDIPTVARFCERDVERLLADAGIVRHCGKIAAAINNARCAERLLETEPSLAAYFWRFEPAAATRPRKITRQALVAMTQSEASVALSKDLKNRGWKFVGPTTMYAFMQGMGLVNDHEEGCHVREAALTARKKFTPV